MEIEYEQPDDPYWMNPDNLAIVLNQNTGIKGLKITWAENGDPWRKKEVIIKPKEPKRRVEVEE